MAHRIIAIGWPKIAKVEVGKKIGILGSENSLKENKLYKCTKDGRR